MTTYVIMNVGTEMLYRKPGNYCEAHYESERGAKGVCTRLNNEYGNVKQWVVMTSEDYENEHNPLVIVFNRLTGKAVQIRRSKKGGCTDPSTEQYHSM